MASRNYGTKGHVQHNTNVRNLFARSATVRHGIVGTDFTKVAGINIVISETTVDQPRLVKVRVSCVDVRKLYGDQILHLLHSHTRTHSQCSKTQPRMGAQMQTETSYNISINLHGTAKHDCGTQD